MLIADEPDDGTRRPERQGAGFAEAPGGDAGMAMIFITHDLGVVAEPPTRGGDVCHYRKVEASVGACSERRCIPTVGLTGRRRCRVPRAPTAWPTSRA